MSKLEHLTYYQHMELFLYLMRFIGMGFVEKTYYGRTKYHMALFFMSLFTYVAISQLVFMIDNYKNLGSTTETMTTFMLGLGCYVKLAIIYYYQEPIRDLYVEFEKIYTESKKTGGINWEIVSKYMHTANIISSAFQIGCDTVLVVFMGSTNPFSFGLPLPAPSLGLPTDNIPGFFANLFTQFIAMVVAVCSLTGYLGIFCYYIMTLCAQIEILHSLLLNFGKSKAFYLDEVPDSDQEYRLTDFAYTERYLKNCVMIHQRILTISRNFIRMTLVDCLSEVGFTTIVGCMCFYQILERDDFHPKMYPYIGAVIVQILLYCSYGNLLLDKGLSLCYAINQSDWYRVHPSQQKTLSIMLGRVQIPIQMSAIFVNVNLMCFTQIVKTAYSYFTVMSTS